MAKRQNAPRNTKSATTTATNEVTTPATPDNGLRWSIDVGFTLRTSDIVDPNTKPSKFDNDKRVFDVAQMLPKIRQALVDLGLDVPDDMITGDEMFVTNAAGAIQKLRYAPVAPAPKPAPATAVATESGKAGPLSAAPVATPTIAGGTTGKGKGKSPATRDELIAQANELTPAPAPANAKRKQRKAS